MRECDHQLTHKLDLSNQRLLTPFLFLGMYILPTVPTVGAIFKNAALRDQCAVETIWMVGVIEPSWGLFQNF